MRYSPLIAAAMLSMVALPAAAHHGWTSYDETKPVTLTASFTELSWGNPHGSAKMRWKDTVWDVILAPVGRMEARGLTRAAIEPGKRFRLKGYLRRDGTPAMRVESVMISEKKAGRRRAG